MTEIEYKLRCSKCNVSFMPSERVLLYANKDGIERGYRYQDLMIGQHAKCAEEVFGYIGLNDLQEPIEYHAISRKKHGEWALRKESNRVRPTKQKLDRDKYSPVASDTVNGCVYDRRSGKYFFKDALGVR